MHEMTATKRSRQWRLLTAVVAASAGCTILQPIDVPADDRRFPLNSTKYEEVPCVNPRESTTPPCLARLDDDLDGFHGGLGRALWEMDLRRRELVGKASEHTNSHAAYNALLWPLGALLVAKKVRKPEWDTVDAVAIGAATYGLLGSGIPDRDKLYLRSAARMACTMLEFDAELYPAATVRNAPGHDGFGIGDAALYSRVSRLEQLLTDFKAARDRLLTEWELVKPSPTIPATGNTAAQQARLDALRRASDGAPTKSKDPIGDFVFETDRLVADAQRQLDSANRLLTALDASGARLRLLRSRIEGALVQALNDRTPTLSTLQERSREITKAFEEGVSAERRVADRVKKESGSGRIETWFPTPSRAEALMSNSRKQLFALWTGPRADLKAAQSRVAEWTSKHEERVRIAKVDAAAMGCNEGNLAEFAADLAKKVGAGDPVTGKAAEISK